jgi:hypothetical protein
MSEYGWRFVQPGQQVVDSYYGTVNVSPFTKIRCPVCGQILWVPRGHNDTTHDCTLLCPYCSQTMLLIPPDPSQAKVPLVVNNAKEFIEWWKRYFRYCANLNCSYYQSNGVAYMSRKVEVDILVGR